MRKRHDVVWLSGLLLLAALGGPWLASARHPRAAAPVALPTGAPPPDYFLTLDDTSAGHRTYRWSMCIRKDGTLKLVAWMSPIVARETRVSPADLEDVARLAQESHFFALRGEYSGEGEETHYTEAIRMRMVCDGQDHDVIVYEPGRQERPEVKRFLNIFERVVALAPLPPNPSEERRAEYRPMVPAAPEGSFLTL